MALDDSFDGVSRRTVLKTTVGTGALAGLSSLAVAQDGSDASGGGKAKETETAETDEGSDGTAEGGNGKAKMGSGEDGVDSTGSGDGGDGGDDGDGDDGENSASGGNGKAKQGDSNAGVAGPPAPGLVTVATERSVSGAVERVTGAIEANENLSVAAVIDHQQNAASVGLDLRPTTVVLFGNPALGTPLMQASRTAGIDLPQKLLVYEDAGGQVRVGFNDPGYLAARHDITGEDATLETIAGALSTLAGGPGTTTRAGATAGSPVEELLADGNGLASVASEQSVDATVERIRGTLEAGGFGVPLVLDHQQNAASVELDLPPTTVIVFGNPEVGTPLMQASRTTAIDLPQKLLVYEDGGGQVRVVYNDPGFLAERHGITGQEERLSMIADALGRIATGGEDGA